MQAETPDTIQDRLPKVVVVGGGYVGLPMALTAAHARCIAVVLDVDTDKVDAINAGHSPISDVRNVDLDRGQETGRFRATSRPESAYAGADAVLICVPTPLQPAGTPDVSFVVSAIETLVEHVEPQTLIALESTVYPGFTREVLVAKLEERGFTVGKDVFVSFSPERVDPANKTWNVVNTPKVVGGATPQCLEAATAFYSRLVDTVVPVASVEEAEMVKLLENTHRAVNIALTNEIAIICERLKIDVWNVIDAAATKPFGFTAFYPGPGCGGHCLPCDPQYLEWRMRTLRYEARLIHLAAQINSEMPRYVVERLASLLNGRERSLKGANVLQIGLAYKPDVGDFRESPAVEVMQMLVEHGANVTCVEPYLDVRPSWLPEDIIVFTSLPGDISLETYGADVVLITTHHTGIDYQRLLNRNALVFDTRNATAGLLPGEGCTLVRL